MGTFSFGSFSFDSKKQASQFAKQELFNLPKGKGTDNSPLISLLEEKHFWLSQGQNKILRIRQGIHFGNPVAEVFLEEPIRKWYMAGIDGCINQKPVEEHLTAAFRSYIGKKVLPQFYNVPQVADCGHDQQIHFHHINPTFPGVMQNVFSLLHDKDKLEFLGMHFYEREHFMPPKDHEASKYVEAQYNPDQKPDIEYEWLCKPCHKEK